MSKSKKVIILYYVCLQNRDKLNNNKKPIITQLIWKYVKIENKWRKKHVFVHNEMIVFISVLHLQKTYIIILRCTTYQLTKYLV